MVSGEPGVSPVAVVPPITPYLVIPFSSTNGGGRPLSKSAVFPKGLLAVSYGVQVFFVDRAGNPSPNPLNQALAPPKPNADGLRPTERYLIRCAVSNLGPAPCYSGMAEFSLNLNPVDNLSSFYTITNFSAAAGQTVTVTCPRLFTPNPNRTYSILVRAYDPFHDPLSAGGDVWDYLGNRHVARVDFQATGG